MSPRTAQDTGGHAFPLAVRREVIEDGYVCDGMSLRDYFAGQALAGWSEDHHSGKFYYQGDSTRPYDEEMAVHMARFAYVLADAMLAERAKAGAE